MVTSIDLTCDGISDKLMTGNDDLRHWKEVDDNICTEEEAHQNPIL